MFDTHWAPTEIARETLGFSVVSAVPLEKHAGEGSAMEILTMGLVFVVVAWIGLAFPLYPPVGGSLLGALLTASFFLARGLNRSWAWHVLRGDRRIRGKVAVFFDDRVELHDEGSIGARQPIEMYPIETVRYSGFTEWANPRLLVGETTWSTNRAYTSYIAMALAPAKPGSD